MLRKTGKKPTTKNVTFASPSRRAGQRHARPVEEPVGDVLGGYDDLEELLLIKENETFPPADVETRKTRPVRMARIRGGLRTLEEGEVTEANEQPLTGSKPPRPSASVPSQINFQRSPTTNGKSYLNLPSAGLLFQPAVRPDADFVEEVRVDLLQPVHLDITPRGLHNPKSLCYRNSVVVTLLNSSRFLTFLHLHMRKVRHFYRHRDISGHLLTRLYHLAVAYWDRDGLHPMLPCDTYERLLTLFWRGCKVERTGDGTDMLAPAAFGAYQSWPAVCAVQDNRDPAPLYEQQHDATDMFFWLLSAVASQLQAWPAHYGHGELLRLFNAMFRVDLTVRYVCHLCHHPVRMRRQEVEVQYGLLLYLTGSEPPRPQRRVQRLADYIDLLMNGEIDGRRCERCSKTPRTTQRLLRFQSTCEVLTFRLGRAYIDESTQEQIKVRTRVDIPQFLDVSPWLEPHVHGRDSRVVYRLSAVISHSGDGGPTTGGHYVAFVRKQDTAFTSRRGGSTSSSNSSSGRSTPFGAPFHSQSEAQAAMDAHARLQRSMEDDLVAAGLGSAVGGRDIGGRVLRPETIEKVRQIEGRDSQWVRISDSTVTDKVPFSRISNASLDPTFTEESPDWFDPVLLVYEKCIEEFHRDPILYDRVYQEPMNADMGHDKDMPVPKQWPPDHYVGEPYWAYESNVDAGGTDATQVNLTGEFGTMSEALTNSHQTLGGAAQKPDEPDEPERLAKGKKRRAAQLDREKRRRVS